MKKFLLKFAIVIIKRFKDEKITDIAFIEKIISEMRELFKRDNIKKDELENFHYQFKYYDSNLDKLVSKCNKDEKLKIRQAILAARVLCWALRFETSSDNELVKIMNERKNMIIKKDASHSSYEIFMQKLLESGWSQDNDTKVKECNISKVKEWCRAKMDELQDLAIEKKKQIIS